MSNYNNTDNSARLDSQGSHAGYERHEHSQTFENSYGSYGRYENSHYDNSQSSASTSTSYGGGEDNSGKNTVYVPTVSAQREGTQTTSSKFTPYEITSRGTNSQVCRLTMPQDMTWLKRRAIDGIIVFSLLVQVTTTPMKVCFEALTDCGMGLTWLQMALTTTPMEMAPLITTVVPEQRTPPLMEGSTRRLSMRIENVLGCETVESGLLHWLHSEHWCFL